MIHLDTGMLSILAGFAIPLITAFVTKWSASSAVKSLVNLTLSAGAGLVQSAMNQHGNVVLKVWLGTALVTWVTSIVSHYGLWTPTTVSDKVAALAPTFGIGPKNTPPPTPPVSPGDPSVPATWTPGPNSDAALSNADPVAA